MRITFFALAASAVLLTGCGGGGSKVDAVESAPAPPKVSPAPPKNLRVTLEGQAGAENASILAAEHRGYLSEVGLVAPAIPPARPNRPVAYVAHKVDDIGITQLPQLVIAREEGMPLVAVGSLIAQPTAAMIWPKESKIEGIADLRGKTIAVPGITYQERFLRWILARAGLTPADVKIERVGYDLVPALVSGRADAIFGGSSNVEGTELEMRGVEPVVTPVQDLGIPDYDELVVIARSDLVAEDPRSIHRFMAAAIRGTATAIDNPRAAINAIEAADPSFDLKVTETQLAATAPLLSEDGYIDPEQASDLVSWMHEQGLIRRKVPVSALLTNAHLP